MAALLDYKCPNCGGELRYDIGDQLVVCDFCGKKIDPKDLLSRETDKRGARKASAKAKEVPADSPSSEEVEQEKQVRKMKVKVAGADCARRTIDFMPFEDTKAGREQISSDQPEAPYSEKRDRENKNSKSRKKSPFMDRTGRVLSGKAGRHMSSKKGKGRKGRK